MVVLEVTKASRIHPLGTMIENTTFHGNPPSSRDQSGGSADVAIPTTTPLAWLKQTNSKKSLFKIKSENILDEQMIAPFHQLVRVSQPAKSCRSMYDFNSCSSCHNMTWLQIRVKLKSKWPMRRKPIFNWWYRLARENTAFDDVWLQMNWNNYIQYI